MRISDGVKAINASVLPPVGDYVLLDAWTTIDGQWYVSNSPYSIPQWAVEQYAIGGELGGAHHLYVRVVDETGTVDMGREIAFRNNELREARAIQHKDGFANLPVWNVFYPDQGQNGGWETGVVVPGNTTFGLQGGGLPYALHVSLFAVYQKKSSGGGNGNGDGGDNGEHHKEIWLPTNTIVDIHTNGFDLTLNVKG